MTNVIQFTPRRHTEEYPTFTKIVDGEKFECVDVDALSPSQRKKYFENSAKPER